MDSANGLGEWFDLGTRRMVSVNGSCAQINTRETPVKHLCDDLCERQWTYYRKREMSGVLKSRWGIENSVRYRQMNTMIWLHKIEQMIV